MKALKTALYSILLAQARDLLHSSAHKLQDKPQKRTNSVFKLYL
jgi:hypothetical protein